MKITKESKYAHSLDRCEVESVVNPLKDKEPTPAWYEKLTQVLKHYDISFRQLSLLAEASKRSNLVGNPYTVLTLKNTINNFKWNKGTRTWTKNAQYTVNDHLDILIDYLSKPRSSNEEHYIGADLSVTQDLVSTQETPVVSLRERLEKERAEGKWPSVDEKIASNKLKTEPIAKVDEVVDVPGGLEFNGQLLKPIDEGIPEYAGLGESNGVKVKLRKIRKHKKRKITINIYI